MGKLKNWLGYFTNVKQYTTFDLWAMLVIVTLWPNVEWCYMAALITVLAATSAWLTTSR